MRPQKKYSSRLKQGSGGYSYTNTRVKVRKTLLYKPDDFKRLMKMSLPEIAGYLDQGKYKKEIEALGIKFKGINLIEYALNRNLEDAFRNILGFSIAKARNQIKVYLNRYDIANIKTIIRGKNSGAPNESIINELIACGEFTREFLESVVKKSSGVSEAADFFSGTGYYGTLKKNIEDVPRLEDELDKSYYARALANGERELKDFLCLEIWVRNTLNRLRSEKSKIAVQSIPGGKMPKGLAVDVTREGIETRIALRRLLVSRGLKMVYEFKRNVRPILGFFIAKENEVSNIRIIARGKHTGLPEDLITKHLVM